MLSETLSDSGFQRGGSQKSSAREVVALSGSIALERGASDLEFQVLSTG